MYIPVRHIKHITLYTISLHIQSQAYDAHSRPTQLKISDIGRIGRLMDKIGCDKFGDLIESRCTVQGWLDLRHPPVKNKATPQV